MAVACSFPGSAVKYCAIRMNSLAGYDAGFSPVENALKDLEDSGTHEGMVNVNIIDAPYGLGKAEWDMSGWTKDDFISVLQVRTSSWVSLMICV
jgi:hypothetical protein